MGTPSAYADSIPLVSATPAPTVGFDGLVYASTHVGATVYLGGNFTHAIVGGKSVARKRLAAVDTRTGKLLPWAPLADGTVMALTAAGSSLYVTGEFTAVGGAPRRGLASVDLKSGAVGPLRHTVKGTGQALAATGGRLYLGGSFTSVDGKAARNLAAFRLSDGALDGGFHGRAGGRVRVLTTAGSRLYAGGDFKGHLAALRLTDGQADGSFRPATPFGVMALTVNGGRVYAALAGPGGRVAAYRPDGSLLWSSVTDGDVQAITYLNGAVYGGGHFTVACPAPSRTATSWCPAKLRSQPKLAAWNPATGALLGWNPHSNGRWGVLTLSINPATSAITVGGDFTAFGGADRARFAQFRS
jgi:outer membrane protein assembly factor BamB